jgi:hypothetical protein
MASPTTPGNAPQGIKQPSAGKAMPEVDSLDLLLADDTCWGSESLEDLLQELGGSDDMFNTHLGVTSDATEHLLVTPAAPAIGTLSPAGPSSSHSSSNSCDGFFPVWGKDLGLPAGVMTQQPVLCYNDARYGSHTPDLSLPAPAFVW